jgi:tetratricopeptide (TPR) repeat protein
MRIAKAARDTDAEVRRPRDTAEAAAVLPPVCVHEREGRAGRGQAGALAGLGRVEEQAGDWWAALGAFGRALVAARRGRSVTRQGEALLSLGALLLRRGAHDPAIAALQASSRRRHHRRRDAPFTAYDGGRLQS